MKQFFTSVAAAALAILLVSLLMRVAENKGWLGGGSTSDDFDADMFDGSNEDNFDLVANTSFDHYDPRTMLTPDNSSFQLKITRTGSGDGAKGIGLFGPLEAKTGYNNLANVSTYTGFEDGTTNNAIADYNKVIYTYTGGDIITVECTDAIAYPSLLEALKTDFWAIKKIRLQIADTANVAQFNNVIKVMKSTVFGAVTQNSIVPGKHKQPSQFQNGIIDINDGYLQTKEISLVTDIADIDGLEYTMDFFLDASYRL